jgi:hypothetical protein
MIILDWVGKGSKSTSVGSRILAKVCLFRFLERVFGDLLCVCVCVCVCLVVVVVVGKRFEVGKNEFV